MQMKTRPQSTQGEAWDLGGLQSCLRVDKKKVRPLYLLFISHCSAGRRCDLGDVIIFSRISPKRGLERRKGWEWHSLEAGKARAMSVENLKLIIHCLKNGSVN